MNLLPFKLTAIALTFSFSFTAQALDFGQTAPNVSLPRLVDTTQVRTLDQYRGKVVYLDFWASWCAPCRTSFPLLEKLYTKYKAKGFTIVAINLDEELEAAQKFLQLYPVNFDILRDGDGRWADIYAIETMPTSYIIDKKGIVRHIHNGFTKDDMEAIEQIVTQLLAE